MTTKLYMDCKMSGIRKASYVGFIVFVLVNICSYINDEKHYARATLNNAIVQNILATKINQLQQKQILLCRNNIATLTALLSYACSQAQTNTTIRAQCMTCFTAATANVLSPTLLSSLLPCAMLYLNTTNYATCITTLQTAVNTMVQVNSTTGCPTGYCTFVQCLRRVQANALVDMCYMNSLAGNNINTAAGRTNHYLLTTSCILAMARCNPTNPISGVTQNINTTPVYNSVQVSRNGDLRIITVPRTSGSASGFCLADTTLTQSGWGTIIC